MRTQTFLARVLVQRPIAWSVVAVTLLTAVFFADQAQRVEHDDDLLAFLPKTNPEIGAFYEINKRFGGLDTALIGLEAPDIFAPDFLRQLKAATDAVDQDPALAAVLSLSNVEDFEPDPAGGITSGPLIRVLPHDEASREALKARVLQKDYLVGNLVSESADAVLMLATLTPDADPRLAAERIRAVMQAHFTSNEGGEGDRAFASIYYGGNPFISSYIFDTTQRDMNQLTPWAVLVIVLIMLIAFRDLFGTLLALISTGIGILIAIGSMSLAGEPFNIVLGGMPVILFAVGSAYGIHILSRYYAAVRTRDVTEALVHTLVETGPAVIVAGLTTFVGLLSFVAMDIKPLRTFGVFTALGILTTLFLSLTFIPAVVVLMRFKGRQAATRRLNESFAAVIRRVSAQRTVFVVGLGLIAAGGVMMSARVDTRMDPRAFYHEASPPARADAFLTRHFGGSQFAQVLVEGDLRDPEILREVQALGDAMLTAPHVTDTAHVAQVVAVVNEAMEGARRVPDSSGKVKTLYGFLTGRAAVRQILTDDREQALIQVKLNTSDPAQLERALEAIEAIVEARFPSGNVHYAPHTLSGTGDESAQERRRERVALRVAAVLQKAGLAVPSLPEIITALDAPQAAPEQETVVEPLRRFLRSEEALVELPKATEVSDQALTVAQAVVTLGQRPSPKAIKAAVAKAIAKPETDMMVDDIAFSLEAVTEETWRDALSHAKVNAVAAPLGITERLKSDLTLRRGLSNAMVDLSLSRIVTPVSEPKEGTLAMSAQVTGMPVLHRGLSRSVTSNQFKSLGFALGLVFLLMTLWFKSVTGGLLATAPTALTLVMIYGSMALLDVHLDIGTSMLASIIIGAGVDYAVHFLDAWRVPARGEAADAAQHAAAHTGPAIWTNALAVCAGFFVLTLGQARPLQNVGGLTSAAMLTAAVATFLVIPALARRRAYGWKFVVADEETPAAGVDVVPSGAIR